MLLIYITPLLPEFLTVVIPAHIAASTIFVMFYFSEDKFVWFLLPVAKYFSGYKESVLFYFCLFVSSDVVVYVSLHKNKQMCIEQHMTANFVVLLSHVSVWRTQNV